MEALQIVLCDWAIPLPGIYSKEKKSQCVRDICTSLVVAALFTVTKTWKQPMCPSADPWIKKIRNTYTVEYYSVIKKGNLDDTNGPWRHFAMWSAERASFCCVSSNDLLSIKPDHLPCAVFLPSSLVPGTPVAPGHLQGRCIAPIPWRFSSFMPSSHSLCCYLTLSIYVSVYTCLEEDLPSTSV